MVNNNKPKMNPERVEREKKVRAKIDNIRNRVLDLLGPMAEMLKSNFIEIEKLEDLKITLEKVMFHEGEKKTFLEKLENGDDYKGVSIDMQNEMIKKQFDVVDNSSMLHQISIKRIVAIAQEFKKFLEVFSVTPLTDVFDRYLKVFIDVEKVKNGKTSKLYKNLYKIKAEYLQDKKTNDVRDNETVGNLQMHDEIIQRVYISNLDITEKYIEDILDLQKDTQDMVVAEKLFNF